MISPQHLVGTLLEMDDAIPQTGSVDPSADTGDFSSNDVKDFVSKGGSSFYSGSPIQGYYSELRRKIEGQRRLKEIGGGRGMKIDRNTWLIIHKNQHITVRFWNTDIITVEPDDTLEVNNGGWQTLTTLSRLCEWLPGSWRVYQHQHEWYWQTDKQNDRFVGIKAFKTLQPFNSGDKITADGILHPVEPASYVRIRQRRMV